jgi:hypothetical protein
MFKEISTSYPPGMALFGRARTATGAGVVATLVLVLVFGNEAYTEWAARHASENSVWNFFLRELGWPSWVVTSSDSIRDLIARDLRALLLLLFVALILSIAGAGAVSGGARFVLGWSSLVFGSALAALLTSFINANASWLGALTAASDGSRYGLWVGWIIGIAVATAGKSSS